MNHRDPQGLALAPSVDPLVELMDWLASPDGGALRMDQAIDIARAIARGEVPNVGMITMPAATIEDIARRVREIELQTAEAATKAALISLGWTPPPAGVMTTDGGRTWIKIELAGPNDSIVTHGEWMEVDGKRIPLDEYLGSYQHTLGKSE